MAIFVFCTTYFAHADSSTLPCGKAKQNNCKENSLIRSAAEEPLVRVNQKQDDLKYGQLESELSAFRKYDVLTRGNQNETLLTKVKKDDFFTRGQEEDVELKRGKRDNDLTYTAVTDHLVINRRFDELERGAVTEDLSENRRNDELSRGADDEPLSRCN